MTSPAHDRSLPLPFTGETALVTGAASGIGSAIADLLLSAGIRTICADLREPDPSNTGRVGLQVSRAVDVTDRAGLQALIAQETAAGGLDYVVNSAGIAANTGYSQVSREQWLHCLEVNLVGAYNVLDAARPGLRRSTAASVVNIASIEGTHVVALSNPDPTPQYAASKAGLLMFTRTSARALASDGVRVNSISPGFVATPMALAAAHSSTESLPRALQDRVPLGRFATPEEIADAAVFLLSDRARYITGTDLRIDGGFTLT